MEQVGIGVRPVHTAGWFCQRRAPSQRRRRLGWDWRALVWAVVLVDVVLSAVVVANRLPAGHLAESFTFGHMVARAVELSFLGVGLVLVLRRPDNKISWIVLAVASLWPLWSAAFPEVAGGWVPPVMLLGVQLLLRFPDGELPSVGWRWFSIASWVLLVVLTVVVSIASPTEDSGGPNPYFVPAAQPSAALLLLLPVMILVSAGSLVVRYRRAGAVQREQIRWVSWAGAVVAISYGVALVGSLPYDAGDPSTHAALQRALSVLQIAALMSFAFLPISIGVAVLRYHLYEIDRIISRTAAYTTVTAALAATFAAVVLSLGRLLPDRSQLAVAVATLAVAALARPLLQRVQGSVDHRFNRARYDAVHTVDAFGIRLRHEVHTQTVATDLRSVVATTLQPTHVAIWLRERT